MQASSEPKMFKVERIDGMCVVVKNLERSVETYWKTLGLGPWRIYRFVPPNLTNTKVRGKPANYTFRIALHKVGSLQYELIQPLEGSSIYKEFLEKRGEGLQHIQTLFTDMESVEKILKTSRENGIEVIQSGQYNDDIFFYLGTEAILGTVYEVVKGGNLGTPEAIYPPP